MWETKAKSVFFKTQAPFKLVKKREERPSLFPSIITLAMGFDIGAFLIHGRVDVTFQLQTDFRVKVKGDLTLKR